MSCVPMVCMFCGRVVQYDRYLSANLNNATGCPVGSTGSGGLHACNADAIVMPALPRHLNLTIEHNPHKAYYQTVEQWLDDDGPDAKDGDELRPEDRAAILATGELWTVQWYPNTPIGSVLVCAATLPRVLERALEVAGVDHTASTL